MSRVRTLPHPHPLRHFPHTDLILSSYIPGHIHAFYLEYIYYDRREQAREGRFTASRAPGVYSERVQGGGQGYGTIVKPVQPVQPPPAY